jgi:radical SAM superfamily enzyme YgiQ (UPF0313 family)
MRDPNFDLGVLGEGEHTMLEIVDAYRHGPPTQLDLEKIQGICFRRADGTIHQTPRRRRSRSSTAPVPGAPSAPAGSLQADPDRRARVPKFSMISSRGCPFHCVFCQKAGSGYRMHSPAYVVDEMEHLVRDFGAQDIAFVDSLFTANRKRVEGICDEIERRGVKVSWTCSSRVEIVDKPILQRMKDAGCWRTRFGIESGSDRVLDFISKGITKERIRAAVTAADEVGLRPKAFFMVGHMPDDEASILETIDFAKSLPLHDVTCRSTRSSRHAAGAHLAQGGRQVGPPRAHVDRREELLGADVRAVGMEPEQLVSLHRKFYRDFYLRPTVLGRTSRRSARSATCGSTGRAAASSRSSSSTRTS